MKSKEKSFRKAGVRPGIVFGIIIVVTLLLTTNIQLEQEEDAWHVVFEFSSARAENQTLAPTDSRWISFFCLDYAETPGSSLVHNSTDWGNATNVSGYQYVNRATPMDLKSEDPFYFVCRAAISDTHCADAGVLFGNRTRCHFTISGDETVTNQVVYGDNTSYVTGGGMISCNISSGDAIYINYFIDDNSDGYRMTDDGTLAWNVTVMARY